MSAYACYVLKFVTGTDGKFYPAGGFREPAFELLS